MFYGRTNPPKPLSRERVNRPSVRPVDAPVATYFLFDDRGCLSGTIRRAAGKGSGKGSWGRLFTESFFFLAGCCMLLQGRWRVTRVRAAAAPISTAVTPRRTCVTSAASRVSSVPSRFARSGRGARGRSSTTSLATTPISTCPTCPTSNNSKPLSIHRDSDKSCSSFHYRRFHSNTKKRVPSSHW